MNDVFHDVSIGACWNGGKHIAGCESATVHHRLERAVFGSRNNVRHIEERASQLRIPLQDSGQQKSVAAGDVHDGMNAVKIVGVGDGGTIDHGYLGHGIVENLSFGRILLQIVENVSAVDLFQRLLAGSDAIFQV